MTICTGDSEETKETAWVPKLPSPESTIRTHVLPRDGVQTPKDHTVAQLVRAPSLRVLATTAVDHATDRGRRWPGYATAQDTNLHGPVQISGFRCVQTATADAAPTTAATATAVRQRLQSTATVRTSNAVVIVWRFFREWVTLEFITRYVFRYENSTGTTYLLIYNVDNKREMNRIRAI